MKKREKLRRGEGESFGDDFLGLHLNAHYDSNENDKISIDDIIDECKTFYSAGHGTTSILLSWTIFLLAIHKDWQEKARKEVLRLFGQNVPTSEGISRLKTVCSYPSHKLFLNCSELDCLLLVLKNYHTDVFQNCFSLLMLFKSTFFPNH